MKRHHLLAASFAVLVLGGLAVGDDKKDKESLQGTWQPVQLVVSGKEQPEKDLKDLTVTIKDDRFVFRRGTTVLDEVTLALDSSKDPKTVDVTPVGGRRQGMVHAGLYVIDGDKLKMCWAPPGKERPGAFESKAGSDVFLLVLQRAKEKPAP